MSSTVVAAIASLAAREFRGGWIFAAFGARLGALFDRTTSRSAIVGALSLIAVITGWWPILGVVGAQLAIGLAFGRRYCVPCLLYFEVIQPRIGEGPIEDSRPPRFANLVGAIFLLGATAAYLAGFGGVGLVLGTIVAALALLAASTGLCVGCEMYRIAAKTRGRFFLGSDQRALAAIYTELDALEKQDFETLTYRPKHPLFQWPLGAAVLLLFMLHVLNVVGAIVRRRQLHA